VYLAILRITMSGLGSSIELSNMARLWKRNRKKKRTTRSQAALSSEEQNVNDMTIVEDTPVRKRTTRSLGVVPSSVEKKPIKKRAARSQGGPSSIEATPVKKRKIQRSVPSLKKDPPVTQRTIRAIGRGTVQKRTTRSLGTPFSIEKDANYLAIERGITRKRKPKPDLLSSVEHGLIKDEARNNETKENGIKLVEMNQLNGDEECRLKELCESSKCSARIQRCDTFSSDKDGNVKDENNVSKKDCLDDRMEQVVRLEEPNMLLSDNYVPLNNDSLAEDGEDTRLKSLCANIKCSVRLNMYNCNLFKEGKYEYGKHDEDLGLEEGSLRRSITGRRNSCGTGRKRRHASTC